MKVRQFFTSPLLTTTTLRWWIALLGYILYIACILTPSIILASASSEAEVQKLSQLIMPMQFFAMFVLGVIVMRSVRGRQYKDADLGFITPTKKQLLYAAGTAVLFVALASLATYLLPDLSEAGKKVSAQVGLGESMLRNILVVMSAAIAAPLGEELIYRAMIFRGLHDELRRRKTRLMRAVVFILPALVSAWLFATSHGGEGQDRQVLFLTLFGVMMAWLYWKTASIYVPVFAHSVTNAINFFFMAMAAARPVGILTYLFIISTPAITLAIVYGTHRLLFVKK
jgi:membrane protease YdiL (CAAX protease family)